MNSNTPPEQTQGAVQRFPEDRGEMAFAILEGLSDCVYVLDAQGKIVFANQAFAEHMNWDRGKLLGTFLWDVIAQVQYEILKPAFQRVMASGKPETFTQSSLVYSGRTVNVRVFAVFTGVGVAFRDITTRVAGERALATSEAHLRLALHGASMGDWSWNAETDAMTMSDQTLELYGLGPEDQGLPRAELRDRLIHPDDIPAMREAAARASAEQIHYDVEYRIRRGGDWRWMRVMGGPHRIDGVTVGLHGLVQDIDERKRASERQQLLIHELNHRVKNILAMVQAIANQTFSAGKDPDATRKALEARLIALAQAHDVLTREGWGGAELSDIVEGAMSPHQGVPGRRFRIGGPRVRLEPNTAVSLAMCLHELATNAIKFGALSDGGDGWVDIGWTARTTRKNVDLRLSWTELGGPVAVAPERIGFGMRIIGRSLSAEGAVVTVTYPPQGLRCDIQVELPLLSSEPLSI